MFKTIVLYILLFINTQIYSQSTLQVSLLGDVSITVVDSSTNKATPVRVRLTQDKQVVKVLPEDAIAVMYGLWDHADGFGFQPDSAFYTDGTFSLRLPEGEYSISLSKGIEYVDQQHTFYVKAGVQAHVQYNMVRWIDMPSRGWYSADDHIHIRRSPNEDPLLMKWIQAEDVHVGVLLRMGDFWATYYQQYAWGKDGVYQDGDYMLAPGQEDPRTPELGHALGLGASGKVRYANEYYYYDKVFDKLHELGGITGYAHQAESFHGYRGLILDGLRGKVDVLELLQFCVSEDPLQTRHYYHLLDLGYAVTAVAGSDFPWCGNDHDNGPAERNARIGNARFYTFVEDTLTFESWKEAVRKGRTFVTSGPVLNFKVNGKLPGDTLQIKKGSSIHITAEAFGNAKQVPLQKLELVMHGKVIATVNPTDRGQSDTLLSLTKELEVNDGFWIAARVYAGPGQAAHTTPVYVPVDKGGFINKKTLEQNLNLAEQYLKELKRDLRSVNRNPEYQGWRYTKGIERRINETRNVIQQLRRIGKR